jgi:glycosyltransferase involved in cell wall biosynthesis
VSANRETQLFEETAAAPGLMTRLDTRLPSTLPLDRGTAIFCSGACFHRHETVREIRILVDDTPIEPVASRMPRLDLFQMLHPRLHIGAIDPAAHDPASPQDPEVRCYRSGFWTTIRVEARDSPGTVELRLMVRLEGGDELIAPLGRIEIVEPKPGPAGRSAADQPGDGGLIAVCLATFNPDMGLFRAQIESLRAQTARNWVCVVSDDCSEPARFEQISRMLADDSRFVVSRAERNLGYYRNFERALGLVPANAEFVALCDQDDRWHADKLEVLREALGSAQLVYSDQRLVHADGTVLRDTLWEGRRNNHTDLASLLIANSVTGAAMLFRREVAEVARPFPDVPGWQFHDHWLALVAMSMGDIAYVDRPLYDYVQHPGAILGQATEPMEPRRSRVAPLRSLRSALRGWRAAYFYGYLPHEVEAQALLARCAGIITIPKRRILERFIASANAPIPFAWLAARPLRALAGANETLGTEAEFVRGIVWRHLTEARVRRQDVPGRSAVDATCPPLDADALGQTQLARWRARI